MVGDAGIKIPKKTLSEMMKYNSGKGMVDRIKPPNQHQWKDGRPLRCDICPKVPPVGENKPPKLPSVEYIGDQIRVAPTLMP